MSDARPHTSADSSATPTMGSVRVHLVRLKDAHDRMHDVIRARVEAAARRHEESRPQPPPENTE